MDWLGWVRGILVVALFGWLLESLQPASSMRRYTRLAIGLLLMIAVLRPVIGLLHSRLPTLAGPFYSDTGVAPLLQKGVFLQKSEQTKALSLYRTQVRQLASASAEAASGGRVQSVQVGVSQQGAPQSATLGIKVRAPTAKLRQAVQTAVGRSLGIAPDHVTVRWIQGGGSQ